MSKIFNHTVQPLGSTKSPVEDLALEVEQAFDSVESIVDTSNSTVTSVTGAIGNPLFPSLDKHKVLRDVSESHTVLPSESDIVLENSPDINNITVSYKEPSTGSTIPLTKVDASKDFTAVNQFKIKGKVLSLNVRVPKDSSLNISTDYRTESFGLNDKKFLSNVIKKNNNTFLLKPTLVSGNTFALDYELDLNANLESIFLNPQESIHFFSTLDGKNFTKLEVESYNIVDTNVEFTTEYLNSAPETLVLSYINNTSISDLLNALYFEYKNHTHSNHEMTGNIDSKDLVNRYINNNTINYKNGDVPNYQFPQYLNREGYNPNLDSVYENSLLGTLFLSRIVSDSVQKYKGLDKDSNKISFGDPILGPTIKYGATENSLMLDSVGNLNGLTIITNSDERYSLKLNGTVFTSNGVDNFHVKPQGNVFNFTSKEGEKFTLKYDIATSRGLSTLDQIRSKKIRINDIEMKEDPDTASLLFVGLPNTSSLTPQIKVDPELIVRKMTVDQLVSTNSVSFTTTKTSNITMGDVSYKKTPSGVEVASESANPETKVIYKVPVEFDKVNIKNVTGTNFSPKTLSIGDVNFTVNPDSEDNGLEVISTVPTSSINFKSKVDFVDLATKNLTSPVGAIDTLTSEIFSVGDVDFVKDSDGNIEVKSSNGTGKIVFNAPVEFKKATSQSSASIINLDVITTGLIKIGKQTLEKKANGDLSITPAEGYSDSIVDITSKLKVNVIEPTTIRGENASGFLKDISIGNLSVGNNHLTDVDNNLVISPENPMTDKVIINSDTEMNNVSVNKLTAQILDIVNSTAENLKFGKVLLSKDAEDNLTVSAAETKKAIFTADTVMNKVSVSNLKVVASDFEQIISKIIKVGAVVFQKDVDTESLRILRTDAASKLKIELPTEIENLNVTNLTSDNEAYFSKLTSTELNLESFKFKRFEGTSDLEVTSTEPNSALRVKSRMIASNLLAEVFNANDYKMYNEDRISVDTSNYLLSSNGRFNFINNKAIRYIGSSKDSGFSFLYDPTGAPVLKQYISANSGSAAVDAEKNVFVELDTSNGMYFLEPTNKKKVKNGVVYGFNDPTAQRNVSDLRSWFRADIHAGDVTANSLELASNDGDTKGGISIGDTRISVIGANSECPSGLTVFESGDSIHFVRPLGANQSGCRNLTYQEINIAAANISGELSVDGNASITESILVNGTVATGNLSVTEETELVDTVVAGTLNVSGDTTFLSAVNFKNGINLGSDLTSSGDFYIKSLEVESEATIKKDLKVDGDLEVGQDIKLRGSLSINSGINSDGIIKSQGIDTTQIRSETLTLLGSASVAGTTTLQGRVEMKSSSAVQGNFDVSNSLNVRESITADNIFSVKDITVGGALRANNTVELSGKNISIGSENSIIQLDGKLQFNTSDVVFNSPVKIFSSLRITDEVEVSGEFRNKSGIKADSFIYAKGSITTDSTLETKANLIAKTASVEQNLDVGNSITSDNVTTDSIAVSNSITTPNLSVTKSLSMPVDTTIVAGNVKFSSVTQTDSSGINSFAGTLSVSRATELLGDVSIGKTLVFNNGAVSVDSNGLRGASAKVDVDIVAVNEIKGKEKVQPPVNLTRSRDSSAISISNLIGQRSFVRMDHIISEGISIFNQPLVADTIYYNDLVYIGDDSSGVGAVNITARKALYA